MPAGSVAASPYLDSFEVQAVANGTLVRHATLEEVAARVTALRETGAKVGISSELAALCHAQPAASSEIQLDTWFSLGLLAVAVTGTVVVAERSPADRIPALLCRRHVLLLPTDMVVQSLSNVAPWLRSWIADGLRYVTFVSGPSRTSDIEKVLTIGAHGPVELEVVLFDRGSE